MSRLYLFSDESGDLAFKRGRGVTRYFSVGTLLIDEKELGRLRQLMGALRDNLAWNQQGLDSYFHASEDNETIRRLAFATLDGIDFRVDVTMLDKPKAQPQAHPDEPTFFRYAWFYHLKYLTTQQRIFNPDDEVMVVAAEIGTKKGRKAFRSAVEQVMTQCIDYRVKRVLAFWPCSSDFALQAADYCVWAVMRGVEHGDWTYYEMVKSKIASKYDIWSAGTTLYY